MYVIIVGGGKVGAYLATLLLSGGEKVKVIDIRRGKDETDKSGDDSKNDPKDMNSTKTSHPNVSKQPGKVMEEPKTFEKMLQTDTKNVKLADKEMAASLKDQMPQIQQKLDQSPAVFAKQYATFSSSVSKANLESLLENITARAVVTLRDGKSEMKLNLTPPELGRMSMKLTLEDGQMIGKIVVSTPEAKMLFDQNLGELQRQLQQAGVNVGQLDVSLGQPDGSANQDNQNQPKSLRFGTAAVKFYAVLYGKRSGRRRNLWRMCWIAIRCVCAFPGRTSSRISTSPWMGA